MRCLILVTLVLGVVSSGCSLFREDFPSHDCQDNLDCFRAQGEVCNLETQQCEIPADAGPIIDAAPVPDAPPRPDAAPLPDADLTPDADLPDAGAPDAV